MLVLGWRLPPWWRACSSSSTASIRITGGLSMWPPSGVPSFVGCSVGPGRDAHFLASRRARPQCYPVGVARVLVENGFVVGRGRARASQERSIDTIDDPAYFSIQLIRETRGGDGGFREELAKARARRELLGRRK